MGKMSILKKALFWVKKGKGAKDRIVMLAQGLAEKLKAYRTMQRPTQKFVFEGKTAGEPIAPRTIQWSFITARRKNRLARMGNGTRFASFFCNGFIEKWSRPIDLKTVIGS